MRRCDGIGLRTQRLRTTGRLLAAEAPGEEASGPAEADGIPAGSLVARCPAPRE